MCGCRPFLCCCCLVFFTSLVSLAEDHAENSQNGPQEIRETVPERTEAPDSDVQILSEVFSMRASVAKIHEERILEAIELEDETKAAELVAELVNSKKREERPKILERLKKEFETKKNSLMQRLIWSLEENLKKERGNSSIENAYKEKVKNADEKAQVQNREFTESVKKAAAGDREALEILLKKYNPEALVDFMAAEKNVALVQALGWKDKDGKFNLDLKANDPGFRKEGNPETQTWVMGTTPEEIEKSLENFSKTHGVDFESTTPSANRFSRFTLNSHEGGSRHFFTASEGGTEPVVPDLPKAKICQVETLPEEKRIPLEHTAWYFFRQFPDSPYVGYAGDNGGESQNFMVDLNNPGKEIRLPGPYDPVPTPDDRYITVPDGIKFYTKEEAIKKGEDAKPFFEDSSLDGVYQSIGTVAEDATSTTYRIISDKNSLSFRDYKVTHAGADGTPKVEALRSAPQKLCANTGITLVTPILSKDGKQVSFLDVEEGVTKIFDITNPDTGECKLSLNFGIYTGKLDFNYNGDEIVFHKYENERPRERYIAVPSDDLVGNVYIYKRSTKQLTRLTNNTHSNSVYPSFRKDGMVMYLDHSHHEENADVKSSLVIVDPRKGRAVDGSFITPAADSQSPKNRHWQAMTALGALWSNICSPAGEEVSSEGAVLATLNLFPKRCAQLVEDYWLSFRRNVVENRELAKYSRIVPSSLALLTPEEIKNACPREGGAPPPWTLDGSDSGSWGDTGNSSPVNPIPQSCFGCHSNPRNFIPFRDLERLKGLKAKFTRNADGSEMSMVEAILDRISSSDPQYRMPQGTATLTASDRVALRQYLLGQ